MYGGSFDRPKEGSRVDQRFQVLVREMIDLEKPFTLRGACSYTPLSGVCSKPKENENETEWNGDISRGHPRIIIIYTVKPSICGVGIKRRCRSVVTVTSHSLEDKSDNANHPRKDRHTGTSSGGGTGASTAWRGVAWRGVLCCSRATVSNYKPPPDLMHLVASLT